MVLLCQVMKKCQRTLIFVKEHRFLTKNIDFDLVVGNQGCFHVCSIPTFYCIIILSLEHYATEDLAEPPPTSLTKIMAFKSNIFEVSA